ncbi:hypothetical protein J3Q64DRAFT_1833214 [Phycomyces blakesleeanus]|uniref:MARVEL domain-containing protein n=2 Tax=Phycomyces blakesleeanus TaxID=4837 RepID=A0A167NG95_PHYB8|nr:hypothetical protein PHYBLDRAFT_158145 [Phycomyces blakesleeanus NRRL 1555(-)]OAD75830.1 hypothetical protein PHYBLDRAFT_158145 [Phycomyces blakesleeanus NRRL 1555(-)]|eukprot:XP_018293870.1 hypothetical protein PHYBLDRAFT_158145 [Phycomyces blakesleeanus NRRL 1555(-)]
MSMRKCGLIFLRFLILIISAGALGCHVAQIVLLENYSSQNKNVGSWWPSMVPYILYFVGPGFSVICALTLVISTWTIQAIRHDRILSGFNIALLIAVIIYSTMKSGTIPWTNGQVTEPSSTPYGFASYCDTYSKDQTTFYRCWLVNGTWLGSIISAALWIILFIYTVAQKKSDIYCENYDPYDFKSDVPMAKASAPVKLDSGFRDIQPVARTATTSYRPKSVVHPYPSVDNNQGDPNYGYYSYSAYDGYYEGYGASTNVPVGSQPAGVPPVIPIHQQQQQQQQQQQHYQNSPGVVPPAFVYRDQDYHPQVATEDNVVMMASDANERQPQYATYGNVPGHSPTGRYGTNTSSPHTPDGRKF